MSAAGHSSRPHWSARAEDRFNSLLDRRLYARGWRARIEPFTGYGNSRQVRLLARLLLTRRPTGHQDVGTEPLSEPPPDSLHEPLRAVRGWRSFFAAAAVHTAVIVELDGQRFDLRSDRGGYLDATIDVTLEPGWHQARLSTADGARAVCWVLVIGDDVRLGVVSDIDDTVMVTALPRPLLAAWNAFVLHESARRVVPGMPVLYADIEHAYPDTPVVYLSTGAWNVAPALRRFLAAHGFPAGPLLLTDWGPTNTGLFRSGQRHKTDSLRQLTDMFPHIAWLLVGDDGQHDPEIYTALARERPDRVRAILLRQLTPSEHVLSHGGTGVIDHVIAGTAQVPVIRGHDGSVLRDAITGSGLL